MTQGFLFLSPFLVGGHTGYRTSDDIRAVVGGDVPEGQEAEAELDRVRAVRDGLTGLPGIVERLDIVGVGSGVQVPDVLLDQCLPTIIDAAVEARCCLLEFFADDVAGNELGAVLVNCTGEPSDCMMRDSRDHLVFHVDRESVLDTLTADIAQTRDSGERAFVVVEPVDPSLSPVPGVSFVQTAALPDGRWTVEHRAVDRILEIDGGVDSPEDAVSIIAAFLAGDGEDFLALDWADAGVDVDSGNVVRPVTFLFFRAADFDDAPEEFRTARDFDEASANFLAYVEDEGTAEEETPAELTDFAAWINRRAIQAADDPENPPSHLYMDLPLYPVRPHGRLLSVSVPLAANVHDDTFTDLMLHAAAEGLCMLEASGRVWVNASGPTTDCRVSLRGGGLLTSATPEALHSTLESAVIAGTTGFVLSVEPARRDTPLPVPGVRELQVGIGERCWIVHLLTDGGRFDLVDPGQTVADMVTVLTEYLSGDDAALRGREWEDISEGKVPDETTRWQLSDSAGNVFNVGEAEVHVAVPMNYAPDLDWFQVADQVVPGDYITADRHLGTQWSVMWGHDFGEETYYQRIVDTREDAESLIHAYIDESEQEFLARGWDLVDND